MSRTPRPAPHPAHTPPGSRSARLHRSRALTLPAAALALTAALAGCTASAEPVTSDSPTPSAAAGASAASLFAAPNGHGDCSQSSPCSVPDAVGKAGPGDVISLKGGDYGDFDVNSAPKLKDATTNAVVEPAPGETATFGRVTVAAPHVTWHGIRVTGVMFLNAGAEGARLEKSTFDGTGLFLRTSHAVVTHSEFSGGSSVDGIQVGGARDVLIEHNTVHDYNQNKNNGLHADCMQVFDSREVTIRANRLRNCYNAGIILSPGRRTGNDHLLIESNFVQGCIVKSATCGGGSAADLHDSTVTNLTVRNNTFLNGSVRLAAQPGLVFDRNIVAYISTCDAPMTNTVVMSWNTKLCKEPDALAGAGNRTGQPTFADQDSGDLHLTDKAAATIDPTGDFAPAAKTIDGTATDPNIAGAAS